MDSLVEIFNSIKEEPSRNGKESILEKNKDNELFLNVLKFVYNPYIITGISNKKINKKINASNLQAHRFNSSDSDNLLLESLEYLKKNNTGKDKDILFIQNVITLLKSVDEIELFKAIVTKNVKIGITSKTINKVYGDGFIPSFGVQTGLNYKNNEDKLGEYFYITTKLDGVRGVARNEGNSNIKFFSKNGKEIEGLDEIEKDIKLLPSGYVYDGELLLENDNNVGSMDLFRATQSIVSSKGTKKNVVYNVFDIIPIDEFDKGESNETYKERREKLEKIFKDKKLNFVKKVDVLYQGKDTSKIDELFLKALENNLEGIMINNADAKYKSKRVSDLLKLKEVNSFDGVVVGMYEADETKKYAGYLGGVNVTYKDRVVNVGNGFSDDDRVKYWNNPSEIMGKVVEIMYTEETKNKDGEIDLRFARWKGIRNDKNISDVNYES